MRAILEHTADDDWVVSLDDDDPPPWPDVLARLVDLGGRLRATEPRLGAVGMVGGRFSLAHARSVRVPDDELDGAVPVDWIAGNQFPVYSVAALRAVGVFDERLFFGFEELDYGLRLGAAGWSVRVDGSLWRRARTRPPAASTSTPSPPAASTSRAGGGTTACGTCSTSCASRAPAGVPPGWRPAAWPSRSPTSPRPARTRCSTCGSTPGRSRTGARDRMDLTVPPG